MTRVSSSIFANAPARTVFGCATRYEELVKILPEYYVSVTVKSTRGAVSVVEEHLQLGSRRISMMTKHVAEFPVHDMFVIGGDIKGSSITEKYFEHGDKTRIAVNTDIKISAVKKLSEYITKDTIQDHFEQMSLALVVAAARLK